MLHPTLDLIRSSTRTGQHASPTLAHRTYWTQTSPITAAGKAASLPPPMGMKLSFADKKAAGCLLACVAILQLQSSTLLTGILFMWEWPQI